MKSIQAKDLSDSQWEQYARLMDELNKKYYPEKAYKQTNWQELKRETFSDLELLKDDFMNNYMIVDNNRAAGWMGIRLIGSDSEFIFDALYDEVPVNFLKEVFEIVNRFVIDRGKSEIYSYTKRNEIVRALTNSGGKLIDRKIFTRIRKRGIR